MSLLYAITLLSAGAVVGRLLYTGNRQATLPWWAREGITTTLIILAVSLITFGIGFLLNAAVAWEHQTAWQISAILGVVVAAGVLWKVLGRALPATVKDKVVPLPTSGGPDSHGKSTVKPAPRKAA